MRLKTNIALFLCSILLHVASSMYEWGNNCTSNDDDLCQQHDCVLCKWSWPQGESWDNPDAACRCAQIKSDWTWGDDCPNLNDQWCEELKCSKCRYSWSPTVSWIYRNPTCRCQETTEYTNFEVQSSTEYSQNVFEKEFPAIQVQVDGVPQTLYVQYPNWSKGIETNQGSLNFDFSNRMYLSTVNKLDTSKYFKVNLMDGSISYDVNLSQIGCGCVTSLYAVLMPKPLNDYDPFKYCDAGLVDGHNSYCPEFDIMEANKFSFRSSAHRCSRPGSDGVFYNCDRNGFCEVDVLQNSVLHDFGPDPFYTIDTSKEFNVKTEFHVLNDRFAGYTTTLSQGSRKVVLNEEKCADNKTPGKEDYYLDMQSAMQEVVIAISSWGSYSVNWLQHNVCDGFCDESATFSQFKNIQITTGRRLPDIVPTKQATTTTITVQEVEVEVKTFPSMEVSINGALQTLYVHYPTWSDGIFITEAGLGFDFNNRMYLSTVASIDPTKYYRTNLLGGSISFDIDLSKTGCGCITAFYVVGMPAVDNFGDPFKYCDAAQRSGYFCPEFDLMEANKYSFRANAHRCDAPSSTGAFTNCDRDGQCSVDVLLNESKNDFGPGWFYTINTMAAFTVQTAFHENDGKFTGYTTTLSQGTRSIVLEKVDCSEYLSDMTDAIQNMVIAISNWGSTSLSWLQHGECNGDCNEATTFSAISNFQVYTKGQVPETQPQQQEASFQFYPTSIDSYEWGNDCPGLNNQLCQQYDCASCKWSWPVGQTWQHSDAACRCHQQYDNWSWGSKCMNDYDDYCSDVFCNQCYTSWPTTSDVNHPKTACRCQDVKKYSSLTPEQMPDPIPAPESNSQQTGPAQQTTLYPPVQFQFDGQPQTLYIVKPDWSSEIRTQDESFGSNFPSRMYLSTEDSVDPTKYFRMNLLGGSISFDVDLSQKGCGCLAALYVVEMPAVDNVSDPFQYCDASKLGGHFCPEFDLMEANKYAFRATAHRCDPPGPTGAYTTCDREGYCAVDVLLNKLGNDFGPGSEYTINTENGFTVDTRFHEKNGQFVGYTTTISQNGKFVELDMNDCSAYLKDMTKSIQDMVMVVTSESSNYQEWLEHGVCTGFCDQQNTKSVYSNIQAFTKGNVPTLAVNQEPVNVNEPDGDRPKVTIDEYLWGNPCTGQNDQLCQLQDCGSCRWSWPVGETEQHSDAACRCRKVDTQWTWGGKCFSQSDQYCSQVYCDSCRYSWPVDSDWQDIKAACRCDKILNLSQLSPELIPTDPSYYNLYPNIEITVNEVPQKLFVIYPDWTNKIETNDRSVTFDFNNRMYLSTVDYIDPAKYFKINLLGGSLSFDVDLSKSGCGCLTSLYAIMMPAMDNVGDKFKYCDAGNEDGHFCPEFDLMEANKHAFRTTAHRCDAPDSNGVYTNCDHNGQCAIDVLENELQNDFGPGSQYTINTEQAFNVNIVFYEQAGKFIGYSTIISQEDRKIKLDKQDCISYLNDLTPSIQNMVLAFSNWGSDSFDWLQHGVCTGSCDEQSTLSAISNIQIYSTDTVVVQDPDSTPTVPQNNQNTIGMNNDNSGSQVTSIINQLNDLIIDYEWGENCKTLSDQLCQQYDCVSCKWSWPIGETWKHPEASCRCNQANYIWAWKHECSTLKDQFCEQLNCDECRMSWQYGSNSADPNAACRCYKVKTKTVAELQEDPSTAFNPSVSGVYPSLSVEVNGEATELFVQKTDWSNLVSSDKKNLVFDYNNRMYLSTVNYVDHEKFFVANLLDGSVSFDVNLSQSGCGCLTALYAVTMPSADNTWDPFKYCDAAAIGGSFCPEFDLMEANKYNYISTAHRCETPDGDGVFKNCDRNGECAFDAMLNSVGGSDFGPGAQYKINTEQVFNVKTEFHEKDEIFIGYTTTLTQEGRQVVYEKNQCTEYLTEMSEDIQKMVIVISNWGSYSLNWLQHGVCSGGCDPSTTLSVFNNIKINTRPIPEPEPIPFVPVPETFPTLSINIDGLERTLYVLHPIWSEGVDTSDYSLNFGFNNRMYLGTVNEVVPSKYFKINMLGAILTYDVNLSKVGCGCVSSLYLARMPREVNVYDPFRYCDANKNEGYYCPEFDIMQANKYSFRATGHRCVKPVNDTYSMCDREGQCHIDAVESKTRQVFGPEKSIDTTRTFTVVTHFIETDGKFAGYSTVLSQGGRTVVLERTDCGDYLQDMTEDLTQMVFVLSNWGSSDDLSWLQHDTCTGSCDPYSTLTAISNISIMTKNLVPNNFSPVSALNPGPATNLSSGDLSLLNIWSAAVLTVIYALSL